MNWTTCNFSETPLHLACRDLVAYKLGEVFQESFAEVAMALLDHGASVHIQDYSGYTPLHLSYRQPTVTLRLLSLGADPNARAIHDFMPLHGISVCQQKLGKSQLMLKAYSEAGADFNAPYKGYKCLHLAGLCNPSLIPCLLEVGANVNSLTDTGNSILHVVLEGSKSEVGMSMLAKVPLLLLRGLNPDLPSDVGLTALRYLEVLVFQEKSLVREALLFIKLIVELRELNWEAGFFLDYREEFELDGSHGRMKRWLSIQTQRLEQDGENWDVLWDSLERTRWDGWIMEDGNSSDYDEDESGTDEDKSETDGEGDIEGDMGCAERESDVFDQPESDGREEDSEGEDGEFYDAVQ